MDPLTLTPETIHRLILWSRQAQPAEACGTITPTRLLLATNEAERPELCFVMNGLVREFISLPDDTRTPFCALRPTDAFMVWHSHPATRAFPSPEDTDIMRRTQSPMVIVSLLTTVPAVCVFILDEENPTRTRKVKEYRTCSLQTAANVL
jgi:proteasome lid subunit RPN8/RPN11